MRQPSEYPTSEGIGPAATRGELILDYYMTKMPTYDGVCEAAADLIADVLAYIECERRVHDGEAQAEGVVSRFSTAAMIVDDAQAGLEGFIVDCDHREAAAAEAFRNRGKR